MIAEWKTELVGGGFALSHENGTVEIAFRDGREPILIGYIERAGSMYRALKWLGGRADHTKRIATVATSKRAFERVIHAAGKKIRRA